MKSYGLIEMSAGGMFQLSGFEPHISLRLKNVFPKIPKGQAKVFLLSATPDIATDLLWFFSRFPFERTPDAEQALIEGKGRLDRRQSDLLAILSSDWSPSTPPRFVPPFAPYPYQEQAAAITVTTGRLLLMDEVGLGKTVSALATIVRAGAGPALVIVQAHLPEQWKEEYIEPMTGLHTHIINKGKPYELPKADLYLISYSKLAGWVDYLVDRAFPVVVCDEMQELRHGTVPEKGKAAKAILGAARIRLGLTATPVYNYGSEIFNIVNMLEPGILGTFEEFAREWCYQSGTHHVVNDPPALGTHLRDIGIALRRTDIDVDAQLPPLNTVMMDVEYDENVVETVEAEARLLAQRVISGSFTERGTAARDLDMMARMATGMAKAKQVAAIVRMVAKSGRKVLLGGWHRDVYDVWLNELADLNPVMFTGSETLPQKRKAKAAFIEGDAQVMIISLRSGSGLDGLQQVCFSVVVGELDWSPLVHKQLIGRVRRSGQTETVDAIYCIANGGSDPVLVETLGLKAGQAQGITDPLLGATVVASDETRMKKLAKYFLEQANDDAEQAA